MKFTFPRTIFVSRNSLRRQLCHLLSEVLECLWSSYFCSEDATLEELADCRGSLETAERIAEAKVGPGKMVDVHFLVERKNRARGYYREDYTP